MVRVDFYTGSKKDHRLFKYEDQASRFIEESQRDPSFKLVSRREYTKDSKGHWYTRGRD